MNPNLEWAVKYHKLGWHPFPCRPAEKVPALDTWEKYQREQPDLELILRWWQEIPNANVALATGRGVLVVDLDGVGAEVELRKAGVRLPVTAPRVRTGNGEHVYLACGGHIPNRTKLLGGKGAHGWQVDIRGDGGYVVAPPSLHANGATYLWLVEPGFELPQAPPELLRLLTKGCESEWANQPGWFAEAYRGVGEGERDNTLAKLAGYLVAKGVGFDEATAILTPFAKSCTPALGYQDLARVVRSVARTHERKNPSQQEPGEVQAEHVGPVLGRALVAYGQEKRRVPTGIEQLDGLFDGGLQPGELIFLGARPGAGKTAMALAISRHAAHAGKRILFVSREMRLEALVMRWLAQEGRGDVSALRRGQVGEFAKAAKQLQQLPLWLADRVRSVEDLRTVIERQGAFDLVVVDYLQLMEAPREIRERRLQVEYLSQKLKGMTLDFDIPILCLSSLSRMSEQAGKSHPPTLASLRESGNLEHDADVVIFLHRPDEAESPTPKIEVRVAKNRSGPVGRFGVRFKPEWQLFFGELADLSISAEEKDF